MKLLLDTQAILWFLLDDHRLSGRAREEISGPDALIFVSPASLWEIAIKGGKAMSDLIHGNFLVYQSEDGSTKLFPRAIDK